MFERGFTGYWTDEIFKISEIIKTMPITYRIKDMDNEEISRTWYDNELQKSEF